MCLRVGESTLPSCSRAITSYAMSGTRGPGVPEDQLERVTERFYRVPGTVSNGSGLGLSIVSEIARRNGGSLVLQNASDGFHATYFHLL